MSTIMERAGKHFPVSSQPRTGLRAHPGGQRPLVRGPTNMCLPEVLSEPVPANAHRRPFPWRCSNCKKKEVRLAIVPYTAKVKQDGRIYEIAIPALEIPKCDACGELVFNDNADEQVTRRTPRLPSSSYPRSDSKIEEGFRPDSARLIQSLGGCRGDAFPLGDGGPHPIEGDGQPAASLLWVAGSQGRIEGRRAGSRFRLCAGL